MAKNNWNEQELRVFFPDLKLAWWVICSLVAVSVLVYLSGYMIHFWSCQNITDLMAKCAYIICLLQQSSALFISFLSTIF